MFTEERTCEAHILTPQGFRYVKDNMDLEKPYLALMDWNYYCERYDKEVKIKYGDRSDGATGAFDIPSLGWWVHDELCKTGLFADGTRCTNWQASMILSDILWSEGRYIRSQRWKYATFFLGGDKARDNGMFTLKDEDNIYRG